MTMDSTHPSADAAILVEHLSHQYPAPGRKRSADTQAKAREFALDDVSLAVHRGELFGILGPNGGGKSTLFRILATMLSPANRSGRATGDVHVMGHNALNDPASVRRSLGVIFQNPSLDGQLTAAENLQYHGKLYGMPTPTLNARIEHWLTFFDLQARRDEYVDRFSGGMRRRLELAKALLHEPALLLMDEPATGLDPAARRNLWSLLAQVRRDTGMTVVFTTHLMDEAERCDRLAILSEGKVLTVDTPTNLQSGIGGDVVTLTPEPDLDEQIGCHTLTAQAAKCADPSGGVSRQDSTLCPPGQSAAPDNAIERLAKEITDRFGPWDEGAAPVVIHGQIRFEKPNGPEIAGKITAAYPDRIRSLTVGRPTLEDVFLHMTGAQLTGHVSEQA